MAAKDGTPSIRDLQPEDSSSTSIRAAFYRLVDARTATAAEITRCEQARPQMLLTATTAEIDKADENVRRRRIFADQLDVLERELRANFTIAKEAEEDQEYDAKLAEVRAAEATWNADVRAKYERLTAPLIALLRQEQALGEQYAAVRAMPAHSRKAPRWPAPSSDLTTGMVRAFTSPRAAPCPLGQAISLPSLTPGAALWPAA